MGVLRWPGAKIYPKGEPQGPGLHTDMQKRGWFRKSAPGPAPAVARSPGTNRLRLLLENRGSATWTVGRTHGSRGSPRLPCRPAPPGSAGNRPGEGVGSSTEQR